MTADKIAQLHQAQMNDVNEMAEILAAAARGNNAAGACTTVLGGAFQLSSVVAAGIERGTETGLKY